MPDFGAIFGDCQVGSSSMRNFSRFSQMREKPVTTRTIEQQSVEQAAAGDGSRGALARNRVAPYDPGQLGSALLRLANAISEPQSKRNPVAETSIPGSHRATSDRRAGHTRRAYPRRDSGCDVRVHCLVMDAVVSSQQVDWLLHATPLRASLLDLSMNGLAFLLDRPLELSSRVLLRLTSRMTDRSIDTSATILRSTADDDSRWKIVGRFDHNLTLEQTHEFGRHLAAATIV